ARKKLLVLVTAPSSGYEPMKYPPPLCRVLPKLPPPPEGVAVLTSCAEGEFSSYRLDFLIALRRFLVERADGGRGAKPKDEEANMDGLLAHVRAGVQGKLKEEGHLPFRQNPQLLGELPRDWALRRSATPADAAPLVVFKEGKGPPQGPMRNVLGA